MKRFKKFLRYLFCNQLFFKHKLNICLNKIIGQTRYSKGHVIHSPAPRHSPYNLVIELHLISMSYNCPVAGALPEGLTLFWACPGTGCLRCELTSPRLPVQHSSHDTTLPLHSSEDTLCDI